MSYVSAPLADAQLEATETHQSRHSLVCILKTRQLQTLRSCKASSGCLQYLSGLLIMPATAVLSFTVDVSDECFHLEFMERHLAKKHSSAGSKAFAATTRGLHNWSSSTVLSIWVSQQITQMMGIDT